MDSAQQRDIHSIWQRLKDGNFRLVAAPVSLRASWFPESPSEHDLLLSGYSFGELYKELRPDFDEEVNALYEFLEQPSANDVPDLITQTTSRPGDMLMAGLNRRAEALSLWERVAVPIRVRGDRAYRIWAPRDVFGAPVVKSVALSEFIAGVCEKTAQDYLEIVQLRERVTKWRAAVIALGVLLTLRMLL